MFHQPESFIFARSALHKPIPAWRFGDPAYPEVLLLAGVHGDETEGIQLALELWGRWMQEGFPYHLHLTLIPTLNVDGAFMHERRNGRGVDLNRNLSTKDWSAGWTQERYHPGPQAGSESENQALMTWIEERKKTLRLILSLHSWNPLINVNGPAHEEAKVLSHWTQDKIVEDIGYPTPGSLGTWAGHERNIPTLTFELENGFALEKIGKRYERGILELLKFIENNPK